MPEEPKGDGLEMQPTMGPEGNQYKLLLNVIPRGGKLERRPSIEAIRLGFGYPGRDATSNYGFQHNADGTSGLLADYVDRGGHTGTPADDENGQYVGRWWVKPSMVPVDHEQDLTSSSPKYERQDIAEGIDVEIVNGKLICIYAARQRSGQTIGADSYTGATIDAWDGHHNVKLRVSAHSTSDPSIGRLLVAQTESAKRRISTFNINNLHAYNAVRFWEKRISRIGTAFMLTGYGVGGSQWKTGYGWDTMVEQEFATDLAGVVTQTSSDVNDPHGLLLFNGGKLPFYKVDEPVYNMDRIDDTNSIYTKKRPRNAFMFLDSEGQPVWYGFRRGDRMELQAGIDPANVLVSAAQKGQLSDDGVKLLMDEGTLWFAESMNPHALPVQGFYTAVASSRNSEVVGLARFASGTACFTRDTIEFAQGYFSGYKGQIKLVHTGIGADSRWSIKEIAKGVAFLNKDGVHHLMQTQGGSDVARVTAFDPLFGDGVDFERTPYSDLVVGDTGTGETVPNHANTNAFLPDRYAQGLDASNIMRSLPFGTYRVDKTRIDRAVAGVWEDLYLCAVSRDTDDAGDENRLVLCWNYKENTASVWLLPKFMGIRGFAYDGSVSAPYIMTRFGLAKFGGSKASDIPFVKIYSYAGMGIGDAYNASTGPTHPWYTRAYGPWNTNDTAGITDLDPEVNRGEGDILEDTFWLPVLVAGQTNFISGGGEAFVIPKIMITHEKNRYGWSRIVSNLQNDYSDYKYDDDVDMRIQVWGNQTDLEAGTLGENYGNTGHGTSESYYDMKSLAVSDIGMLDSLYKGTEEKEFRAVRVNPVLIDGGSKTVDHTHGHLRYGVSPVTPFSALSTSYQPSRRVRGPVLRTSTGRSGIASTKQQVQFYTLDSGDIKSVSLEIKVTVRPGGRG